MASAAGGVEIEEVARETPEKILKIHIDPLLGLRDYQARDLAVGMDLPRDLWRPFQAIAHGLWQAYTDYDATLAEINRAPFDMPEAEQELTAGYHTEYSSMKFALFFMAEYIKMIAVGMIGSTMFLGGFQGPFVDQLPWLGPIYLLIKVFIWLFVDIWIRATLPRIRYDKLMALGWKVMYPIALLNVFVTGILVVLTTKR